VRHSSSSMASPLPEFKIHELAVSQTKLRPQVRFCNDLTVVGPRALLRISNKDAEVVFGAPTDRAIPSHH